MPTISNAIRTKLTDAFSPSRLEVVDDSARHAGHAGAREGGGARQVRRGGDEEPLTMSEVGTKLDLARAYMDMGDPDGARNILQEVLAEGSASQKQEARRLIDSLPGA